MKELAKARVLDLTDESGAFCTKLLAMLGADVVRVEPPGGDKTRRIGPFYKGKPHPERSLHWWHYNVNKRSVTLNIDTVDGQALFKQLVSRAAIVVECFRPGYLTRLGLGYDELRKINAGLILTSITPFGQTGPHSSCKGNDMVASAMSGLMYLSGSEETPPAHASIPLAHGMAASQAAAGTLIAFYHRGRTGAGQHVDVSEQDCTAWAQGPQGPSWKAIGVIPRRGGDVPFIEGVAQRKLFFKCADGWIAAYPTYWSHMGHTIQWMKDNGLAAEVTGTGIESYNVTDEGMSFPPQGVMDNVNELFAKMASRLTKRELFEEGQRRGTQVGQISTMEDLVLDEHLAARHYYFDVEHRELGRTLKYSGTPFKTKEMLRTFRRAPFIGEHNEEIYKGELGLSDNELCLYRQANVI